ncbi:MAG: glycosyltransferase family 4 protein [Lachnospiraceae bacterium]|nr:glycosyltransferase family 4 protein [Lachnospiraceae bacterium]
MEYPIDLLGGAQLSTKSICDELVAHPEHGYEPVVICPELLTTKKEDYGFKIRTYKMGDNRVINLFFRIKAFKKIIAEEKPELIHIEMSESLITYGFIRKSFHEIPYIYTDRGMFYGYRKRSQLFMFPVLKGASALVTTTQKNAELWKSNTDFGPVSTIPNTISDAFADYDESKRKRGGRFTIGFAGRICIEKDWPFVPVLVDVLHKAGIEFDVELVLSIFEKGDDLQVEDLRNKISAIIGSDHLHFHQDLSQAEMSDFYYGCDVFAMTSQFESFGKAAVEAMSRGCAVVATDVGGLAEVIGKEENLYTKDTVQKCVDYIKSVSEDTSKLEADQKYFLQRYRENYTSAAYLERHVKLYGEVLAE